MTMIMIEMMMRIIMIMMIMVMMMMTDGSMVMLCYYVHQYKFLTCEGSSLSVTCTEIDDGGAYHHHLRRRSVASIDGQASIALGPHQILSAEADSKRSHQSPGQRLASIALRDPPDRCLALAHRRHH
jgi:hypothetical protein